MIADLLKSRRQNMDGAIEEILVRHRALVDDAIRPLQEDTSIDDFLADIEARVVALQLQEPSFWELRVVEYIHRIVENELKNKLRVEAENGGDTTWNAEADDVRNQIEKTTRAQLRRLLEVLDHPDQSEQDPDSKEHFLETFWRNVTQFAEAPNSIDAREHDNDDIIGDAPPDVMSYEAIAFDDLQFETSSVNSVPSTDELPLILEALKDQRTEERKDALHRLLQISTMELVHCSSQFQSLIDKLLSLLLDDDSSISGGSMRLLYSVLNHVEDSSQFLEVYVATIDMVGSSVASGVLAIDASELFSESDNVTKAVNVLRLLLLMMNRVPHHWIYFPQEILVRVLCSTFIVLMLEPCASGKKTCRPLDVLAVLDTEALWLNKWTKKIPSRVQLFVTIDECGLLSDTMYAMTRVRPIESEMNDFDKLKVANMLTMLARLSCYQHGRDMLCRWTKLPAHMQLQRRFTSWRGGLETQFHLETLPSENDRLYHFHRTNRQMHHASAMELENGKPLEAQALEGLILSALVIYLLESREARWLECCAISACRTIRFLPTRDDFLTRLLQLVISYCSEPPSFANTSVEEHEANDPWLPFRRPLATETVFKLVMDSISKRLSRGLLSFQTVRSRCTRVLESLCACVRGLEAPSLSLMATLAKATQVRLTASSLLEDHGSPPIGKDFFENLQHLLESAPYTFATILFEQTTGVVPQLAELLSQATDPATRDALHQLVRSLARYSPAIRELCASGVWRKWLQHALTKWQVDGDFDAGILPLLSIPAAAKTFFNNHDVFTQLEGIPQICKLELDVALALNAPPQEAPYRLRTFSQSLAWLRAALASQHTLSLFTTRGSDNKWVAFVEAASTRHKHGGCHASPQSEDACTAAFDILTAVAGCVPSMVGLYDLLLHCDFESLEAEDDGSISACSYLVSSLSSSLNHVGVSSHNWMRPKPLFAFEAVDEPNPCPSGSPTGQPTPFTASMAGAVEHMLLSIAECNRHDMPLDVSMLSQATWELIGDMETCVDGGWDAGVFARTFGKLMFEMARSGRSKLGEADFAIVNHAPVVPVSFPTDAERKLMNRYYKDYCSRLGLKASPTTLYVLTKIFGRAAVDCFAITMLMVLDQTFGEHEIVDVLQYCASCPSIFVLWPRITELSTKQLVAADDSDALPTLLPLAKAAEMVLEMEFPEVFQTLQQCHCSVLTLVLRWHSQCYWNFLPWDQLLIMVYLNFLYGTEFQVYLFVVVLKHVEPTFRSIITNNGSDSARAFVEVLQAPIVGFQFATHRNSVLRLRSTYHDRIRHILLQQSKPTSHCE